MDENGHVFLIVQQHGMSNNYISSTEVSAEIQVSVRHGPALKELTV